VSLLRAEFQKAQELAEQLLHLAESLQDSALLLEAHYAAGSTLFWLGEVARARPHLEQAISLYDPQQHHSQAVRYGQEDRGVTSLCTVAWALWCLGYVDQALARNRDALKIAHELAPPFSRAFALGWAASLHQCRQEGELTRERAEATINVSTEQGFSYWLAWGTILQGWALAEQGLGEEGINQMRQALAAYQATGAKMVQPYFLALLSEVYGKGGKPEEGLNVLAEALALVGKNGECGPEAELYRLKGELTLQRETRGWRLETSPPSPQASSLKGSGAGGGGVFSQGD
jgi:predicted ATPase